MIESNEEPAEIESLEWLYQLEHDDEEAMASLTDAPVRLLLDSGSGVSACSPDFCTSCCEEVGVVKRVHTRLGRVHRLATALKVVEEVQEEVQEIKDE